MKRSILKYMIFTLTLLFFFYCENNQVLSDELVGTWYHVKVDSCKQNTYPNSEILRTELSDRRGITEFHNDGYGVLFSERNILCGNTEFRWSKGKDILTIRTDSAEYITKIEILEEDKIMLVLDNCISRKGLKIWYEVYLSRAR